MVDAHCHLNFHGFNKDRDEIIKEAFEAGVKVIVNVGAKLDSSKRAVELAEKYNNLYASVGVHPHHVDKLESFGELRASWIEQLEELTKNPKVIAIGECGLDYFSYESNGITDKDLQKKAFEEQMKLAIKLNLPLEIHNRKAGEDILEIIERYKNDFKNPPGMFHCFSGDLEFLRKVLDLGFYVGFDGNVTYEGLMPGEKVSLSELVKYAPVDRIITETDSPYLSPVPLRGSRNTPKNVIIVGEYIAKLKSIEFKEFEDQVDRNFESLFGIKV